MKNKINFLIIICIAFISASGIYAKNMNPVDLSKYYTGDGFSFANNTKDENFDGGGYSYPAEEFSQDPKPFGIEKAVFIIPSVADGDKNFYIPDGKEIKINAKADRLFILASSVNGDSFIEAEIKTTKRKYKIHLNVTDWARPPAFSEKIFTLFSGRHNSSGGDSHKPGIFFYRVFLKPPLKGEKIEWIKFIKQSKARIFALTSAFTEDYSMLAKGKKSPNDPDYFSFYPNSKEENYFLYSKGNSEITGAGTRYLHGDGEGIIYKFNFDAGKLLKIDIHAEGAIEMSYSNDGSNYIKRALNFIDNISQTEITVDDSGKLLLKFKNKNKKDLSIFKISILGLSAEQTEFKMSGREDWIGFVSHYPVLKNGADLMPYTENSVIATRPAAWGDIEPKKDEFNFEKIDEMVEYAEKYDLYYVPMIEIDPCHTPKWLLDEIKERDEIQKDAATFYFREPALYSEYFRERMKIVIKKIIEYMKKK
ncbi:beta-galactosidase, partial [bacterium]|nr:beta-galactosidase [bacterium]